ncbi:MAG: hypothetical protein JXA54_01480 [Candidatus Heimdallarchaeota archaeon]|nr:hypothetical protein [Candidatus Heimdallarchaeota archaeon]
MNSKNILTNFILLMILISTLTPLIVSSKKSETEFELDLEPKVTKNWTFMIYFCADTRDDYVTSSLDNSANWLASAMLGTINSLYWYDLLDGSESNLNVLALFDHPYSSDYHYGQAKLYEVQYNNLITLANYGPKNMGDPNTLKDFINYCKAHYPANNYALVLSDHGRGYAGACYDYHAQHESWEYALGDSLSLLEIEQAIAGAGDVDVLIMNTCLGGSYELMWQLRGEAHYVIAGETLQSSYALYHPRDILYTLSRDTTMTPLELAHVCFDFAVAPVRVPSSPYYSPQWPSVTIFDLNKFEAIPVSGGLSLFYAFDKMTEYLYNEVQYNLTYAREVFIPLRNQLQYYTSAFKSKAMMVDLGDFVTTLLEHVEELYYGDDIEYYAGQVLARLTEGSSTSPIVAHEVIPVYANSNLTGFSICFPDTKDMYQEYLYANLYDTFDISSDTYWDEFIFSIYPPDDNLFKIPIPEFYEEFHFFLHPCDPTINLHILIDTRPFEQPIHIGFGGPKTAIGMGIEMEIEGASFENNLIFGSTMIRIPVASIPALSKSTPQNIQVVINASTAASATQEVNVTVRHVDSTGILWEASKTSEIEIGQIIRTNVSTDDQWTDWEEIAPPLSTKRFYGYDTSTAVVSVLFTSVMCIVIIKRKKKE